MLLLPPVFFFFSNLLFFLAALLLKFWGHSLSGLTYCSIVSTVVAQLLVLLFINHHNKTVVGVGGSLWRRFVLYPFGPLVAATKLRFLQDEAEKNLQDNRIENYIRIKTEHSALMRTMATLKLIVANVEDLPQECCQKSSQNTLLSLFLVAPQNRFK